jgi:hypothetical protein
MIIYHLLDRFQPNYLNGKTRVVVKSRTPGLYAVSFLIGENPR